jgi:hypothetical protein
MAVASTFKRSAYHVLRNPVLWAIVEQTLGRVSQGYEKAKRFRDPDFHRQQKLYEIVDWKMGSYARDLVVRNGPFAGMRYPSKRATGSAFYPKVLGSYESELHPVLADVLATPYHSIVDIGCAEGYYAVGLKMRMAETMVYAYDIDPRSRFLCEEMARVNGVSVQIGEACDQYTLLSADLGHKSLVLMDCEGYETELIQPALVKALCRHDFLIESHDHIRIDTTKMLLNAFRDTHDCELIQSTDDIAKAYEYDFAELVDFTLEERKVVLEEYRPTQMRWLFARAK